MKKAVVMVAALALTAAPALAGLTRNAEGRLMVPSSMYEVIPLDANGDPIDQGGRSHVGFDNRQGQYNNLQLGIAGATNYLVNNVAQMVGDDFHMGRKGTDLTGFLWLYTDNGMGPAFPTTTVSHTTTVYLFDNTANDGAPGPLSLMDMQVQITTVTGTVTITTTITTGAALGFRVPEATAANPNGFWGIRFNHPEATGIDFLPASGHGWMGFWSNSANPTRGGVRATQLAPHIGDSHDNMFVTATTLGSGFGDLNATADNDNLRMSVVPEPGVAGLLALSGLLVLRRRRL